MHDKRLSYTLAVLVMLVPLVLGDSPFFPVPADDQVIQRFGDGTGRALDGRRLRVLIWNVYKGKRSGWAASYRELARDKDLVLLQEAYLDRSMRRALTRTGMRHALAVSFRYRRRDDLPTGVLTGAAARPLELAWLRTRKREPLSDTPKMTLFARYALKGSDRPLLVVNVHAINFVPHRFFARQIGRIEQQIDAQGPVLLAGDFNTWSAARLATLRAATTRLGLVQVPLVGSRLDHVFIRGLEVSSVEYLRRVVTSDHKPIAVELRLPRK